MMLIILSIWISSCVVMFCVLWAATKYSFVSDLMEIYSDVDLRIVSVLSLVPVVNTLIIIIFTLKMVVEHTLRKCAQQISQAPWNTGRPKYDD